MRYHNLLYKSKLIKYLSIIIFLLCNLLTAQNYEIKFEEGTSSGWFGGDNRTNFGPRSIGGGQRVLVESEISLNSFSFKLKRGFDYYENPENKGHAVTLILNIRDELGTILHTSQLDLPDSFSGGWATWTNINLNIAANTKITFTAYLVGAFDSHQYTSSILGDTNNGYLNGDKYKNQDAVSDEAMENWSIWYEETDTDNHFWLQGTLQTTAISEVTNLPNSFKLHQNFPNPFNPITTIIYELSSESNVELKLINLNGQTIKSLFKGKKSPGVHNYTLNRNGLESGIYFYQLNVNGKTSIKKLALLK